MRKLLAFLARPIVWSTLALGLLLLALYVVCDLLHLDDSRWLVELVVGAPLTVFLIAYWLRRYLLDRRLTRDLAAQARKQATVAGPDALRDFKEFEDEFKRAFGELNDACRKRGLVGGAAALPWIMVMGPPAVGKTTALDRSGLRFTSLGRRLHGIGPTRNCTWWLASDAIFLDTAGRYAVVDEDKQEWAAFLRLLQRRRQQPLDAVVLQVGLDEILDRAPAEIERAALLLRERLDEISDLLGVQTPVHILFNKCDLLDGFLEFFADLNDDERRQPWGFAIDMAQATRSSSLRERFDSGLDSLISSLSARLNTRLLVQGERQAREAVLGFPDEVDALREPLRRFTETLCGADGSTGHGEQPRVTAVYLASAAQTAERRTGMRHRLGADLGVSAGALRGTPPHITEGTFFLRGVFSHIIRQAEHAVRPSQQRLRRLRAEQQVAVAATTIACLAASWYLARNYRRDVIWLSDLQERVATLHALPGVGTLARRAEDPRIASEIEQQTRVLQLLAMGPYGALGRPHRLATEILRRRMVEQWLQPLGTQLQSELQQAAQTAHDRPSEEFDRSFRLLKAITILQHRLDKDPQCQQISHQVAEESISVYLIEQWQRALGPDRHLLDPRQEVNEDEPTTAHGRLLAGLRFFFAGEEGATKTKLTFNEQLVNRARENLKSAANRPTEVVFLLRASNANLYTKQARLRTDRIQDPGIEQVFTMQGCDRFFDKKSAAGAPWWRCVLDIEEPREPVDLAEVYRQRYTEAWAGWLKGLTLRPDPNKTADLLKRTDETLDALTRPRSPELTQIIQILGRGRPDSYVPAAMRRTPSMGCAGAFKKTVTKMNTVFREESLPEACKLATAQLLPFSQLLTPKPKDADAVNEEDVAAGRSGELYGKFLESGQKLRTTLYNLSRMANNKKPEASLDLVTKTMGSSGDLWAFDEARRSLFADLSGRVGRVGIDVQVSGLHGILQQVESDAWQAVLPTAAKKLDDLWKAQVYDDWSLLKEKHKHYGTQDPEHCPALIDFITAKVKPFSVQTLSPLYEGNNPTNCALTRMDPPFAQPLPISKDACRKIQAAIQIAGKTDCGKAMGAGGAAAKNKPKPSRADVAAPAGRGDCQYRAVSVQLDDSENLHTCGVSSMRCKSEPSQDKRPRLSVLWSDRTSYENYAEGQGDDYFNFLRSHAKTPTPTEISFVLPAKQAPGQCEGFKVTFQVPATGGGGGGGGGKPDDKWKEIDLPASLLHRKEP